MTPDWLLAKIETEAGRLADAAGAFGAKLSIDPRQLLARDIALAPPGRQSPNRHCRMVRAADGWLAVNLARSDDRETVPAWLQTESHADLWELIDAAARDRPSCELLERAGLLGLPVAAVGEALALPDPAPAPAAGSSAPGKVIDLSALWAGPLCGGLLAEAGFAVSKFEDPARPDPTRHAAPELDFRLNRRKQRQTCRLTDPLLHDQIASAQVLITSARPHALARLGLTPKALFARNPALVWIGITAHGFTGPGAMRVGFGDDCAAAAGLIAWKDSEPRFIGDALADPLTGLTAARTALEWVAAGTGGLVDLPLASVATRFADAG